MSDLCLMTVKWFCVKDQRYLELPGLVFWLEYAMFNDDLLDLMLEFGGQIVE